jgi:hypothetical protein
MSRIEFAEIFIRKTKNDDSIVVTAISQTPKDLAIRYEVGGEEKLDFFQLSDIQEFIKNEEIENAPDIAESFYPKKTTISKEDQILKGRCGFLKKLMEGGN